MWFTSTWPVWKEGRKERVSPGSVAVCGCVCSAIFLKSDLLYGGTRLESAPCFATYTSTCTHCDPHTHCCLVLTRCPVWIFREISTSKRTRRWNVSLPEDCLVPLFSLSENILFTHDVHEVLWCPPSFLCVCVIILYQPWAGSGPGGEALSLNVCSHSNNKTVK